MVGVNKPLSHVTFSAAFSWRSYDQTVAVCPESHRSAKSQRLRLYTIRGCGKALLPCILLVVSPAHEDTSSVSQASSILVALSSNVSLMMENNDLQISGKNRNHEQTQSFSYFSSCFCPS
jgi:hypothetical protein